MTESSTQPDATPSRWSEFWRGFRKGRRRLRFTREGKVFVLLTAGIGVGAVNTGNNLLYLLLGAMLGFIVLSGILAEVALRGVEIWRKVPSEIFAGRETSIQLGARNIKQHLPSFSLAIREHFAKNRVLDPVRFVHLPPDKRLNGAYRCVFPRRGRCRFRGWTLETTFPFGLFIKSKHIDGPDTAVVYPRIDVPLETPRLSGLGTNDGVTHRGRGEELYALRDYSVGDDRRAIAWKASARRGSLVTREFARGGHDFVDIYIANVGGPTKRDPVFEASLDYAATLAVRYLEDGYAVGLTTLDGVVEPDQGPRHVHRILTALALLRQRTAKEARELRPDVATNIDRVVVETQWNKPFHPPTWTAEVVVGDPTPQIETDRREPIAATAMPRKAA